MGQYYMIVNLDREEYINPHEMGAGLKMWEICANNISRLFPYLLGQSTGRGGGDPRGEEEERSFGRWAGDRVVVVGDYDETDQYGNLYNRAQEEFEEISDEVRDDFNAFISGGRHDEMTLQNGLSHRELEG